MLIRIGILWNLIDFQLISFLSTTIGTLFIKVIDENSTSNFTNLSFPINGTVSGTFTLSPSGYEF